MTIHIVHLTATFENMWLGSFMPIIVTFLVHLLKNPVVNNWKVM